MRIILSFDAFFGWYGNNDVFAIVSRWNERTHSRPKFSPKFFKAIEHSSGSELLHKIIQKT